MFSSAVSARHILRRRFPVSYNGVGGRLVESHSGTSENILAGEIF